MTAIPEPITADKFVLLFSADWFRPHWKLTGFVPRKGEAVAFQDEMRRLVSELMDGEASYWNADFGAARVSETRNRFLTAVDRFHSDESALGFIRETVTSQLSKETLTELSMSFWDDYEAALDAIRRPDILSTDWDRHLAGLTPDLPSYLPDFAYLEILRAG